MIALDETSNDQQTKMDKGLKIRSRFEISDNVLACPYFKK